MPDTSTDKPAEQFRENMIEVIRSRGFLHRPEVEAALRQVPRHQFVPEAALDAAYDPWRAVITHRFADGTSLSCASAPHIVALMLDQLAVERGNRVLEIGAGTGYNAALLATLAGNDEHVVTIDIDADVTAAAARNLAAAGHNDVRIITGDGADGAPAQGPYDRLIATVSPWDIPAAWWDQLAPQARVVVPLRWRGQTRSVALTYRDGRLIADSIHLCGFVPLVGDDAGEHTAAISTPQPAGDNGEDHEVGPVQLHWDRDQAVDPTALQEALDQHAAPAWSQVTVAGDEPFDGIWLRLTATDPRVCRINAPSGTPTEICAPITPIRAPALVDGASLAYLTSRRLRKDDDGASWWELGAAGHGPHGEDLADQFCGQIRAWSSNRTQVPELTIHRTDSPDDGTSDYIEKIHSRLALTYPSDTR